MSNPTEKSAFPVAEGKYATDWQGVGRRRWTLARSASMFGASTTAETTLNDLIRGKASSRIEYCEVDVPGDGWPQRRSFAKSAAAEGKLASLSRKQKL